MNYCGQKQKKYTRYAFTLLTNQLINSYNVSQESKKCFLSILIGDLLGIVCVQEIVKTIPVNCKFHRKHFLPVI